MVISRRELLIGLAAAVPLPALLSSLSAAADEGSNLMKVSRIIVGRSDLDPGIAQRIEVALAGKIQGFPGKLSALASALGDGADRDAALAALGEADLDLALKIAQPWYTGVVGVGSEHSFEDGAVFITFLGAEASRAVQDVQPFRSYSTGAPGWWAEVPPGVTAPPMPADIRDWAYVPPGATGNPGKANAHFLQMVTPQDDEAGIYKN